MKVPDWGWGPWSRSGCVPLMTISLCLNFHKYPSCLKVSRTLLKNDATLLEFRNTWRFLTGAGSLITFWMFFFGDNKVEFKI